MGEDVTYDAAAHDAVAAAGPVHPLAGEWTLASFSEQLDGIALFDAEPRMHASLDYRRWAYESAALDLALRQARLSLAEAVGREPSPLRFVVSTRSGFDEWRGLYPGIRFKLDAEEEWTDEVVEPTRRDGRRRRRRPQGPLPRYRRRSRSPTSSSTVGSPRAFRWRCSRIPGWRTKRMPPSVPTATGSPGTRRSTPSPTSKSCRSRRACSTPSRPGSARSSGCSTSTTTAPSDGIALYGGGQFELGIGRGQIQLLASLFHPDAAERRRTGRIQHGRPAAGPADEPAPRRAPPYRLPTRVRSGARPLRRAAASRT